MKSKNLKKILKVWVDNNIPTQYAEGASWYEMLQWVINQLNEGILIINDWQEWLDQFVDTYHDNVREHVREFLTELLESDKLSDEIKSAIADLKLELDEFFENVVMVVPSGSNQEQVQAILTNFDNVKFQRGVYYIDPVIGLELHSNQTVDLNGSTIKALASDKTNYNMFKIWNKSNIKISNGIIIGERYEHVGTTGEWGMGIDIRTCDNIALDNLTINDTWGDGIYLGTNGLGTNNTNIRITNCKMDANRRQGISVISCDRLVVSECLITNTNGTPPMNAIDFEPNLDYQVIDNITITNLITKGNLGEAINLSLFSLRGSKHRNNIYINNHYDDGSLAGFKVYKSGNMGSQFRVTLENCVYENNKNQAVILREVAANELSKITMKNCSFINSNKMLVDSTAKSYKDSTLYHAWEDLKTESLDVCELELDHCNFIKTDSVSIQNHSSHIATRHYNGDNVITKLIVNECKMTKQVPFYAAQLKEIAITNNNEGISRIMSSSFPINRLSYTPLVSNLGNTASVTHTLSNLMEGAKMRFRVDSRMWVWIKFDAVTFVGKPSYIAPEKTTMASRTVGSYIDLEFRNGVWVVDRIVGDWE